MAKQSGLGDRYYIAGYDLSGDIGAVDEISGGPKLLDVTGISSSARERIGGLRDGTLKATSWFNIAPNQEHLVFSPLPTADVLVSYYSGQAIGNQSANLVAKQINYDGARKEDGAFSFKIEATANAYGLEWADQLTAGKTTQGAAGALTSYDYTASVGTAGTTAFGLQAYLHVFAFTGTSVTVAVQHSNDNGSTDPFADISGAVFTAATGVTWQRIATASNASIKRYLRVNTTGTFTSATFAVSVVKNLTTTVF